MNNLRKSNSEPLVFFLSENDVGLRIDKWLSENPNLSDIIPTRSFAQNLIESQSVLINNKPTKASYSLKKSDVISIRIPEKTSGILEPYDFPLDIKYEDDDLIVVNKPAGLVVHPAAGHEQDTLVNALLHHTTHLSMKNEERPGIVHRIDKETSGLLVIAKNDFTHDHLTAQFKNKTTHRIYYAVASGVVVKKNDVIKSYLARHPTDRKKYASVKVGSQIYRNEKNPPHIGKWAVTHYQNMTSANMMTYLKIQLETGRTHQIRVHIAECGHPLVGDELYGFSVKKKKDLNIDRFYLHAAELGFIHPRSQKTMLFKSDWPINDLEKIKSWGLL